METLLNRPGLFFPLCTLFFFAAGWVASEVRRRRPAIIPEEHKEHFNTLTGSVLGMLALLLGFTFSMAVSRYDLRRDLQVQEANAIGTTWLRTSLLPEPQATQSRALLAQYVDARIAFFDAGVDESKIAHAQQQTSELQTRLWQTASDAANAKRDPLTASYISTLNDTIDDSEKRVSALENRIPRTALALLGFFAFAGIFLVGLSVTSRSGLLLWILPVVMAAAFTLVLDLDASRTGLIRVDQSSMIRVQQQIKASR